MYSEAFQLVDRISEQDIADIAVLLTQLYGDLPNPPSYEDVQSTTDRPNYVVVVRLAGRIVGMGNLLVYQRYSMKVGRIEDVIVHLGHRGKGIGTEIINALHRQASLARVHHIDLETDAHRDVAIKMYKSMGYERREKMQFRKRL